MKYKVNDEVMNTTGYRCFIEAVNENSYTVSTAEDHDLYPVDEEEVQCSPDKRWELTEDEIEYKL